MLEELGPAGLAFASYLSSRVDLFPAVAREPLAAAAQRCPPLGMPQVNQLLRVELGEEPEAVFPELESGPAGSGPWFQWHRGALLSGEPVVV
jgi:ubiquinone biosynthesis protein